MMYRQTEIRQTDAHTYLTKTIAIKINRPICLLLLFNVPPTAKVIWKWGYGLKSHPTDW